MLILYFGDSMKKYFHGASKKKSYFEGWYFKLQTAEVPFRTPIFGLSACGTDQITTVLCYH